MVIKWVLEPAVQQSGWQTRFRFDGTDLLGPMGEPPKEVNSDLLEDRRVHMLINVSLQ